MLQGPDTPTLISGAVSPPWRRALSIRLRIIRRSSVRIAAHRRGLALDGNAVARGLFGRQRQDVDLFAALGRAHRIEAACEQDLPDQLVELGDVGLDALLLLRIGGAVRHRERHVDAGERRAQLVRGVGEQHLVRADQLLDAAGGAVEARRERRDLVLAFDLHARRKVAFAELLDAGAQPLQPPREAARQRVGADRDRRRDRQQRGEHPRAGAPRPARNAGDEKASVAQRNQPGPAMRSRGRSRAAEIRPAEVGRPAAASRSPRGE